MYSIFYIFVWLLTWLPLRVLYLISDFIFLVVYVIVGYRKKVVRENLKNSFPEKSEKELRKIEMRFYRHFCDLIIETLNLMHMSKKQINKRMVYINKEFIDEQYAKGKSIIIMNSHYANWEWNCGFSLFFPDKPVYQVYRKLNNKKFDQFLYHLRIRFGAKNVEKRSVLREMVRLKNENKLCVFGMMSDQTPSPSNIHYRTEFLNQNTPMLTGSEQLAQRFDYAVAYISISKLRRGYYCSECIPIAENAKETEEFEITEKFARLLEKDIKKAPQYWLWTHKRWKHK